MAGRIQLRATQVDEANADFLQTQLQRVNLNEGGEEELLPVEENWTPEEDYYVHIDVLHGSSKLVSKRINSFMIGLDSFDPRRAMMFPTDLLEQGESDTLANRRAAAGVGDSYYEFWKVRRGNFTVQKFRDMVALLPRDTRVRLVRVIDNEHEITNWASTQV